MVAEVLGHSVFEEMQTTLTSCKYSIQQIALITGMLTSPTARHLYHPNVKM